MSIIKKLIEKHNAKRDFNDYSGANKSVEKALSRKFNCEQIIGLKDFDGYIDYFLMETSPYKISKHLSLCDEVSVKDYSVKLRQLTGKNMGRVLNLCSLQGDSSNFDGFLVQDPLFELLTVMVKGYNSRLINHSKYNELQEEFGKKVSLYDLLEFCDCKNDMYSDYSRG